MTERQAATARADKWFSLYIRQRDQRCMVCGSVIGLTCGHYVTRGRLPTRWIEKNAVCQCATCNSIHEENPEILRKVIDELWGEGTTTELELQSWSPIKLSPQTIGDIADHWRQVYIEGAR